MFGLSANEIMIVLLIALILFGAGRLPEVGRGMGKAIREFKDSLREPPEEAEKKKVPPASEGKKE